MQSTHCTYVCTLYRTILFRHTQTICRCETTSERNRSRVYAQYFRLHLQCHDEYAMVKCVKCARVAMVVLVQADRRCLQLFCR